MKVFRRMAGCFLGVVLLVSVMFFGLIDGAGAEEAPDYRLQVSPVMMELELKPGGTATKTFQVQNTGTKKFDFSIETTPYSVENIEYDGNYTDSTNYNYITDWVTYSVDNGTVEPGKSVEVTATVKVPRDVPSGGQYAMIAVTMNKDDEDSSNAGAMITATPRAGILLFAGNVDGNTRKEGKVTENKVPSFIFNPPISVSSVVRNDGNIHVDATYVLQVFPLFSNEEVYTNEENPETRTILPETSRLNTMSWEGAPQLGIFRVKQTVKFLNDTSVVEKVVFICPLWFLFIVLTIIFLAIFWIVSRIRGRGKERSDDRE